MNEGVSSGSFRDVLRVSARLGLTSFGGPNAHLGYFRDEYVERRRWLDDRTYADLVALCQFLPGPASSQVGIGIGWMRAGWRGALAAWLGFTMPSVILMILFAYVVQSSGWLNAGWIHGLKLAAAAIVAQAVWGMGKSLAPDRSRVTVLAAAAACVLLWPSAVTPVLVIIAAGCWGYVFAPGEAGTPVQTTEKPGVGERARRRSWLLLGLFAALLAGLPLLRMAASSVWVAVADSFYRTGALVFGGGHVVLPLLEKEVVGAGRVSRDEFMAGYGAAQAVPGPLFTFAAYLGASMGDGLLGVACALLATAAIFLPSFLLVIGVLPYWEAWRAKPALRRMLAGINAAVVGILLAALYDPIWTETVRHPADFIIVLFAFLLLAWWKRPPWQAVALAAIAGQCSGWLLG